jgi:anionic cell wall polymer biosynthesis LytR-Cps2A-Psr (LCP) family protein
MKKFLKILLRILIVLIVVIVMIAIGLLSYVVYMRWQADKNETIAYNESGELIVTRNEADYVMQDTVTCLFLGVNGTLTDFIMLGKYDPNTRKVNLMSIPRDTKVDGTYDGKINSAYAGIDPTRTVKKVEEITKVKIDYYVLFKADVLKDIVNKIDGVQ